jgi:hypothetical protein
MIAEEQLIYEKVNAPAFNADATDDPEVQRVLWTFARDVMRHARVYPRLKIDQYEGAAELLQKNESWSRRVALAGTRFHDYLEQVSRSYRSQGPDKTPDQEDFERITNY